MKKTMLFGCLALIIALLSSCAREVVPPTPATGAIAPASLNEDSQGNAVSGGEKNPAEKYLVYLDASGGVVMSDPEPTTASLNESQTIPDNIVFQDASQKDFSLFKKSVTARSVSAVDNLVFQVNEVTYSLPFKESFERKLASVKKFQRYGKFNRYQNDTAEAITRQDTNELLFFSNHDLDERLAEGNLTEEEATRIADAVLADLYDEKIRNEYQYEKTLFSESQISALYAVAYRKYVWGIPTNDVITIEINRKGTLLGFNATYLGLYSAAESDLTQEEIVSVRDMLSEAFSEKWSVGSTVLILDADGEYYLSVQLYKKDTDGQSLNTMMVYVPIKQPKKIG